MLLAVVALAACRDAHAAPAAAGHRGLPPGWQELPALAQAVRQALPTTSVLSIEASGQPAMGCYAAAVALTGPAATGDKVRDEILGSLHAEPRLSGLQVRNTLVGADGSTELVFDRVPYAGRLRARLGDAGSLELEACFWNEREPHACEASCRQLLGGA